MPYDAISAKLEEVGDLQSPANVIEGITRLLDDQSRKLIPKSKGHGYRFSEDTKVGLVLAA